MVNADFNTIIENDSLVGEIRIMSSSRMNTIEGNGFYGSSQAIHIDEFSSRNTIINNTFNLNVESIAVQTTADSTIISNNEFHGLCLSGISASVQDHGLTGVRIENNYIENYDRGIFLGINFGGLVPPTNNVIKNNTLVGNGYMGIELSNVGYSEISGNYIDSGESGPDSTWGINAIGCYSNIIWNNYIYDYKNRWDLGCNFYCNQGNPNHYYNGLSDCTEFDIDGYGWEDPTECNPTCVTTLDDSSNCD